jgi:hypothetical protein
MTVFFGNQQVERDIPLTETIRPSADSGWQLQLDRFRYWVALTLILIAIAYGPFLLMYWPPKLISPGFQAF